MEIKQNKKINQKINQKMNKNKKITHSAFIALSLCALLIGIIISVAHRQIQKQEASLIVIDSVLIPHADSASIIIKKD